MGIKIRKFLFFFSLSLFLHCVVHMLVSIACLLSCSITSTGEIKFIYIKIQFNLNDARRELRVLKHFLQRME